MTGKIAFEGSDGFDGIRRLLREHEDKNFYIPALIHIDAKGKKRIVYMGEASEDEQEAFYRSILRLRPPKKIYHAIMQELGISHREQRQKIERSHTLGLWFWVEMRKAEMRKNGAQPRGGIHEAAISEVAKENNMSIAALKKRFHRHRSYIAKDRRRVRQEGLDVFAAWIVRGTQLRAKLQAAKRGA